MNEILIELSDSEAKGLSQFLKRVGWSEIRGNSVNEKEADMVKNAIYEVQKGLAKAGYQPG
ncbi:MAG: hypothetical protein GY753_09970 [Gammaproteobacteria bacterium]|nr:hypothetical protein [Gammaproteobacteria bacterium]